MKTNIIIKTILEIPIEDKYVKEQSVKLLFFEKLIRLGKQSHKVVKSHKNRIVREIIYANHFPIKSKIIDRNWRH